jgi:hypothetical protein
MDIAGALFISPFHRFTVLPFYRFTVSPFIYLSSNWQLVKQ